MGQDRGHKAHYDDVTGQVPEMLGHSYHSADKDETMARKIEYKNLIQEIEVAHTHILW